MSVYGIVSEFNPFHRGHEYLLDTARKMGAEAVVCVMSGNATQRGELAIIDKYLRAEAAVCGGADLVLELPFPWSSASAEGFATAAVHVLSSFCDTVLFGSECGDIELLMSIAEYISGEQFKEKFSEQLEAGGQSAAAYVSLIESEFKIKLSSNDILGVEYIKAAKTLGAALNFATVKRQGSAYLCQEKNDTGFDSAMALRRMLNYDNDVSELKDRLPKRSFELIESSKKNGKITSPSRLGECARLYFRMLENENTTPFAECEGGVLERICRVAHQSTSAADFWSCLSTKRYTDAKLRRAVLFAMCGVLKSDIKKMPTYTSLLAANEVGRELLSVKKRSKNIEVITKPADVSKLSCENEKRQAELDRKLSGIYSLCLESSEASGEGMKKKPYIT